jgi:type VI secretion system secreted protein VgrG
MPRVMEIATPLGDDVLLFHHMTAREELGRLSEFEIGFLSKHGDIKLDDILAKNVTVKVELPDNKIRYFDGYVTRFAQLGSYGTYYRYHAVVHPWLWFLTRTANCRIFQDLSVPDIVKQIFDDHAKVADFKSDLTGTYDKWDYCVQYRETDFNFVSRLLEQEGIYYYFKHVEGRHTMVLADSASAHAPFEGYKEIPYIPHDRTLHQEYERIGDWNFEREVQTGRYMLDDFDFTKPSVELQAATKIKRGNDLSDYEVYDYPGEYMTKADGEHYVQARLEELQTRYEVANGSGDARGMCCGYLFNLTGYEREDQNREYLITSTVHTLQYSQYEALEDGGMQYHCGFTVISSAQAFRPPRATPKPAVMGPQTAIVVGPDGDEIYTDKYGRVKVQFHWDRKGERNQNSSCWIRVSHPWAGNHWGMVAIPRIGQEVIVDFLEGDPDAPIITGRVYNAEQMPPYDLPANMTQTGVKTRSSKGGSGANFNEIRFEDKKGSEQLFIHAEKNQDIEVENDETHWVGHDRAKTIDHDETTHVKHDRTENVDNNETITIGVDRTESVGSNEKISIGANRTEDVGANENISIGANRTITVGSNETATVAVQRTHTVGANETITVGGAQEITVGGAQAIAVGAEQKVDIGAEQKVSVGADQSVSVGADMKEDIGGAQSYSIGKARTTSVGEDDSLSVGKSLVIDAGDAVTIKTGSASISMKKDGTITIKGKDITLDGSGKINIKAGGDIVMKGSKITQN